MKQYEFMLTKQGAIHTVYCTARTPAIALTAVKDKYAPEFKVTRMKGEFPPHRSYAEIDASMIKSNPKRRPRAGHHSLRSGASLYAPSALGDILAAHARAIAPKAPRKPKADSEGFFPIGTRKQREAWEYHYGIGYSTRKGAAKNPARMARRARPKAKRIALQFHAFNVWSTIKTFPDTDAGLSAAIKAGKAKFNNAEFPADMRVVRI